MSKPDGGPAFGAPGIIGRVDDDGNASTTYINWQGMSLRDYFAAAALNGLLSDITDDVPVLDQQNPLPEQLKWAQCKAESAYRIADAMIVERAK